MFLLYFLYQGVTLQQVQWKTTLTLLSLYFSWHPRYTQIYGHLSACTSWKKTQWKMNEAYTWSTYWKISPPLAEGGTSVDDFLLYNKKRVRKDGKMWIKKKRWGGNVKQVINKFKWEKGKAKRVPYKRRKYRHLPGGRKNLVFWGWSGNRSIIFGPKYRPLKILKNSTRWAT